MTRKNLVAVAVTTVVACCLAAVILLASTPTQAVSHSNYTWKPGCHCGKPTTTVKKTTTTTVKKKTTTTVKRTTTTAAPSTTTTVSSTTTTLETTTTTVGALMAPDRDVSLLWGAPDTKKLMDKAEAIVAGLALSAGNQPPDGPGPSGPSGPSAATGLTAGTTLPGRLTGSDDAAAQSEAPGDATTPVAEASAADAAAATAETVEYIPPRYYVSPVAIVLLLVYCVSFILYRTKSIRPATHRKIWNILLLATFVVTGALGVVLAVGISQNPPLEFPRWLLFWHVEAGIVMSFISFFHVGWHLRYYLGILKNRASASHHVGDSRGAAAPNAHQGAPSLGR